MPAVKLYPILVFVSNSAYRGEEGGVTNEDIIGVSVRVFFIQSSQNANEDLPWDLGFWAYWRFL